MTTSDTAGMPELTNNARDALLSLTDASNWGPMSGDEFRGYTNAMEAVHEIVMGFWGELSNQAVLIAPDDIVITPYEAMTREELIAACEAHDAHHNEHHESEARLKQELAEAREAVRELADRVDLECPDPDTCSCGAARVIKKHSVAIKKAEDGK